MPATPNSQLQKYQTEIKWQGFKIKVVEKAGAAGVVKKLLRKSDSFKLWPAAMDLVETL